LCYYFDRPVLVYSKYR